MHFRQHMPGYADANNPSFETNDWDGDPDSIECIRRWRDDPDFKRFVHGLSADGVWLVMVELKNGHTWRTIGYCEGGKSPQIPVGVLYANQNGEFPA